MEEKVIEFPNINNIKIDKKELNEYINRKLDIIINVRYIVAKGNIYEEFVRNYIRNSENIECWLWKDIPEEILLDTKLVTKKKYDEILLKINSNEIEEHIYYKYVYKKHFINPMFDIGIDILAKKDNEYIFIQCKNMKGYICKSTLTSFYNIMKKYANKGRIYYTGKCKTARLNNIEYINLNLVDDPNIIEEITYNTYIDEIIVKKIINEFMIIKYKDNRQKYMDYKRNNSKEHIIKNKNDYLYSDLKWEYLFIELNDFIVKYQKLPEKNNILNEKLHNFIEYNNTNDHKYIKKWENYKSMHPKIFIN
jgi:hypothetical protein